MVIISITGACRESGPESHRVCSVLIEPDLQPAGLVLRDHGALDGHRLVGCHGCDVQRVDRCDAPDPGRSLQVLAPLHVVAGARFLVTLEAWPLTGHRLERLEAGGQIYWRRTSIKRGHFLFVVCVHMQLHQRHSSQKLHALLVR